MAWNKSNSAKKSARRANVLSPSDRGRLFRFFVLVGMLFVAAAFGILTFLGGKEPDGHETPGKSASPRTIAAADPSGRSVRHNPGAVETKPKADANPVWAEAKGLDPTLFPYTDGRKVIATHTNEWMAIDICIMPSGVRRKVRRNVAKRLFSHVTDEVIMQAISSGLDEVGPPIPFSEDMEEEFRASLGTPIVIDENDTPEQRAIKEAVKSAREVVIDQINAGRTFFDAVNDHLAAQTANQEARETVMAAVEEMKAGGDGDLVDEYLAESNKILEDMGASPILRSDVEEDAD